VSSLWLPTGPRLQTFPFISCRFTHRGDKDAVVIRFMSPSIVLPMLAFRFLFPFRFRAPSLSLCPSLTEWPAPLLPQCEVSPLIFNDGLGPVFLRSPSGFSALDDLLGRFCPFSLTLLMHSISHAAVVPQSPCDCPFAAEVLIAGSIVRICPAISLVPVSLFLFRGGDFFFSPSLLDNKASRDLLQSLPHCGGSYLPLPKLPTF